MSEIKIEKKTVKYSPYEQYYLYSNTYGINLGNYFTMRRLSKNLNNFLSGFFKNSYSDFKVSFNDKYYYIQNTNTKQKIFIQKEDIEKVNSLLHKEIASYLKTHKE